MKLQKNNIELDKLITPANFAKTKNVSRKWIYKLMENDALDFIEIDGVKFIYLNDKTKEYKRTQRL